MNLTLDITGILDNGYHEIDTIFQSISLYDEIEVENNAQKTEVICDKEKLNNEHNICFNAISLFLKEANINDNIKVKINKNIPLAAGMAGGSVDAAAVLTALDIIYNHPINKDKLMKVAAKLGADIPFCMVGGTVRAKGIGEKMQEIRNCPDCDIILVKEGTKPSTAELYRRTDSIKNMVHPNTVGAINAIENGNLDSLCENIGNVFAYAWDDSINNLKKELILYGAKGSELSGSGPTIFGIFEKGDGEKVFEEIKDKYTFTALCHPINYGIEIIETE